MTHLCECSVPHASPAIILKWSQTACLWASCGLNFRLWQKAPYHVNCKKYDEGCKKKLDIVHHDVWVLQVTIIGIILHFINGFFRFSFFDVVEITSFPTAIFESNGEGSDRWIGLVVKKILVIPARFERATHSLEGCCSIQLSYGTWFAGAKITNIKFWTKGFMRPREILILQV